MWGTKMAEMSYKKQSEFIEDQIVNIVRSAVRRKIEKPILAYQLGLTYRYLMEDIDPSTIAVIESSIEKHVSVS